MPMIAEAAFAMLACARIGAIHSVVFGGFASVSLASRIEDADAEGRSSAPTPARAAARWCAYKPLLDEAIRLSTHKPRAGAARRSRAGADGARRRAATTTGRALREQHRRHAGPLRMAGRHRHQLHDLHERHDRPAQGRAARRRRLCGGAGRQHEAHLPAASRARPTSPPATSAGWWATATSSTGR